MRALAVVGRQPSALAVAVKSFCAERPGVLRELQLLSTAQMSLETDRLCTYFARELPQFAVPEPIMVATRLPAPHGGPPGSDEIARTWLARGNAEQVALFADPGLKSVSIGAALVLPPDTLFVHADPLAVYLRRVEDGRETIDRIAAGDLGLHALIELFGMSLTTGGVRISEDLQSRLTSLGRSHGIAAGITVTGPRTSLPLQAAYEKGGWLYGLVELDPRSDRTVNQMRDVHASRRALWPLQPTLAVRSSDRLAQARGESEQLQVLDGGPISLALWLAKKAKPPLYACLSVLPPSGQPTVAAGAGGGDSSLCVWLGPDPSATLNSIYTHRPATAYLLYDETTPLVRAKAAMLKDLAAEMPATRVHFVPSDMLGTGVAGYLARNHSGRRALADLTPGRVSQALAVLRLPEIEKWQQEGDAGIALRLDGTGRTDLIGARLDVQARAVGGPLRQAGHSVSWSAEEQQFFELLSRLLASARRDEPSLVLCPLPAFYCSEGEVRVTGRTVTAAAHGQTLSFAGWRRGIAGGYWFEELVANRLFAAGVAEEARIGMAWAWPPDVQTELERKVRERRKREGLPDVGDVVRDEIDVAIRLGHRFCAVSCKTDPDEDLERAAAQISAVAETGFGRFCLVALAHPGPISTAQQEAIGGISANLVLIDLPLLADGPALAQAVRAGWRHLSTRE